MEHTLVGTRFTFFIDLTPVYSEDLHVFFGYLASLEMNVYYEIFGYKYWYLTIPTATKLEKNSKVKLQIA